MSPLIYSKRDQVCVWGREMEMADCREIKIRLCQKQPVELQ